MISPVRHPIIPRVCVVLSCITSTRVDGGWLKQHPIPSDKGSFGNFEALAQQNRRLIQQILSEDSSSVYSEITTSSAHDDHYDVLVLQKLRSLYASCINEDLLDARGAEPLLHVLQTVRKLYKGETTVIDDAKMAFDDDEDDKHERSGLTAAIAYLHSKG